MIVLFVDFKSSNSVRIKSEELIEVMERIAPSFEERFKFAWTDDEPGVS